MGPGPERQIGYPAILEEAFVSQNDEFSYAIANISFPNKGLHKYVYILHFIYFITIVLVILVISPQRTPKILYSALIFCAS